ncbi:4Fe-4S dicluster domain-containing protein [uncultured Pseudodesulfovibrio sp.]|uniref:4Fe-4S dicluster domain-containing protein n=1 Tax=uncultured Pseudodesulfovibrio sp. TaxID=2035858 RepID=UPI0029C8DD05|nr:4Fe-4S dicluster domain-containing protein [uncultured Pseudodesulfovibrio sp.]
MLFTPTVVKNLLKKPATRNYPFVVREPFPNFRGELVIDIEKCIFCGMCERKCPSQCISVDKTAGTWQCDPHACISCGYCRDNCPTKCLTMKDVHRKPMTEKITWIEQGTPPKPKKKKAAASVEAAPKAEKAEKPEAKKTEDK